jgi:cysteine synthase A
VKDRAAKGMIARAEREGRLRKGGTIVEGSAGNTGIGIATLAAARGYQVVVSAPDDQSAEKYEALEALGADVRKFPPVPFTSPEHFYHRAKAIADGIPGAFWANQFENLANADAHYEATGPEIWEQAGGKLDIFTCAAGTGGTLAGISRFLRERSPGCKVVLADPHGSSLYCHLRVGRLEAEGSSVAEGVGIARLTANFKAARIDEALRVSDAEMIDMLYHLAENDGLAVGTSSGINASAAYRLGLASRGSGKVIVTIFCDHGSRYKSRVLNPEWLAEKGLRPKPLSPSLPIA